MGTVYIVQEPVKRDRSTGDMVPSMDLSPAAVYGDLVPLLGTRSTLLTPGPTIADLKRKLRDFSDDDHILAVGDPVAIGITVAVAAQVNNGRVAMLKWDRESRAYIRVPFDINHS